MKIANFNDEFAGQIAGGVVTVATVIDGGDVTGTVGNLTVTAVNGVAIPGTPSAGARLESTSGSAAAWVTMFSASAPANAGTAASAGTATAAARADHVHLASEIALTLTPGTALGPYAAAGTPLYAPVDGTSWVTRGLVTASVGTPNSGSAYWSLQLVSLTGGGTATNLGSAVVTSGAAANTTVRHPVTIGTAVSDVEYALVSSTVGTPGALTVRAAVLYRPA